MALQPVLNIFRVALVGLGIVLFISPCHADDVKERMQKPSAEGNYFILFSKICIARFSQEVDKHDGLIKEMDDMEKDGAKASTPEQIKKLNQDIKAFIFTKAWRIPDMPYHRENIVALTDNNSCMVIGPGLDAGLVHGFFMHVVYKFSQDLKSTAKLTASIKLLNVNTETYFIKLPGQTFGPTLGITDNKNNNTSILLYNPHTNDVTDSTAAPRKP